MVAFLVLSDFGSLEQVPWPADLYGAMTINRAGMGLKLLSTFGNSLPPLMHWAKPIVWGTHQGQGTHWGRRPRPGDLSSRDPLSLGYLEMGDPLRLGYVPLNQGTHWAGGNFEPGDPLGWG